MVAEKPNKNDCSTGLDLRVVAFVRDVEEWVLDGDETGIGIQG